MSAPAIEVVSAFRALPVQPGGEWEHPFSAAKRARPGEMAADPRFPGVLVHKTAFIEVPCESALAARYGISPMFLPIVTIGAGAMHGPERHDRPRMFGSDAMAVIQNNVSLYEGVEIEEDVFCGPSCVFTNVVTPRAFVSRKSEFRSTIVGRGASIGANATIVCGVTRGIQLDRRRRCRHSGRCRIIALVVGTPARHKGWVSRVGESMDGKLTCPATGEKYELDDRGALRPVG